MKKIDTVRFKDKTYDYLCNEEVEVGDIVSVVVFKETQEKTVEKVSYLSDNDIANANFKYKEAVVVKRNSPTLTEILGKKSMASLVSKIKRAAGKLTDPCIVLTHQNFEPKIMIYNKGAVVASVNYESEKLEYEK